MVLLFSLTLFLSAALMFWGELMFGKMALPFLGGSPSVWNTCMVFYQSVLLLGYSYAHLLARQNLLIQRIGYAVVILLGVISLPISIPVSAAPDENNPFLWLIALLARSLGLPFLALATTSPLLQRWFAITGAKSASDPYFLFAASNAGSFAALLAYPFIVERLLPLHSQTQVWAAGYFLLIVLTAICMSRVKNRDAITDAITDAISDALAEDKVVSNVATISKRDRIWWIVLSLLPSSLLLGVTSYLSIDIAPVPLLWVVPLALYLLTFVVAFARVSAPIVVPSLILAALAGSALFLQSTSITEPLWMVMLLHLSAFSALALACHSNLAHRRPAPQHLTEFYFFIALGGALGGMFNAIVAPALFDSIVEYPLAMVLSFAAIAIALRSKLTKADLLLPLGVVAVSIVCAFLVKSFAPFGDSVSVGRLFMFAFVACLLFAKDPTRTAIAFSLIFFVGLLLPRELGNIVYSERNFFGVKKVLRQGDDFHWLVHGHTVHGGQALRAERSREPLTYYHPAGPLGEVFQAINQTNRTKSVAVIGLGVGAMSYYARPGQKWTYFEIDPAIAKIARNKELFSFLDQSQIPIDVVLGDARLSLNREPDQKYDLIVVDAFGSDAIPVHLITREAANLYKRKLTPHGLLLFHVSNEHYRLSPVLANIAADAGLSAVGREHREISEDQLRQGLFASHWVVMYRDPADIAGLGKSDNWKPLTPDRSKMSWTDDFSDVLSAVKWVN